MYSPYLFQCPVFTLLLLSYCLPHLYFLSSLSRCISVVLKRLMDHLGGNISTHFHVLRMERKFWFQIQWYGGMIHYGREGRVYELKLWGNILCREFLTRDLIYLAGIDLNSSCYLRVLFACFSKKDYEDNILFIS